MMNFVCGGVGKMYWLALPIARKFKYELVAECFYIYYRKLLHMFQAYILAIFRELQFRSPCKLYVSTPHIHTRTNVTIIG
jgi:hypothetical protein